MACFQSGPVSGGLPYKMARWKLTGIKTLDIPIFIFEKCPKGRKTK